MENFTWYNPTKLHFGRDQIFKLHDELKKYQKVLLVYGGGSIKKTGLYDQVIKILKKEDKFYLELSGIEPNPKIKKVREGIEVVKEHDIDLLLAVGGGSTLDTAKAIAVGAVSEHDILDLLLGKYKQEKGISIGTILTLAATGSEMNPRSVISDADKSLKLGLGTWDVDATYPNFSICDPTYTLSVPKDQTMNGIVDIISHTLEQYFSHNTNNILGDQMAESLVKTMVEIGPKLINDLQNYELRETMMICGTMAWNGWIRGLNNVGDWSCHKMEHALSAVYDIAHGSGLAIVTPVWMEYCAKRSPGKFVQFAKNIFDVCTVNKTEEQIALEGINRFREFLQSIGAPSSMKEYDVKDVDLDALVEKTLLGNESVGNYIPLYKDDVNEILSKAF